MVEMSGFANLPVYTRDGTFVGNVRDLLIDLQEQRVDSIMVGRVNPALIGGGQNLAVPYRWVSSFDDVMILKYFPEKPADAEDGTGFDEVEITQPEEPAPAPSVKKAAPATRRA